MSNLILLDRPIWPKANRPIWILIRDIQCAHYPGCRGYIVPLKSFDEGNENIFPLNIDQSQSILAHNQEINHYKNLCGTKEEKKLYTGMEKPRPHIKIFGK